METICTYVNNKNECLSCFWDEDSEEVLILNYGLGIFERLIDMKNMNYDMLSYIAQDFDYLDYVNDDLMYIMKDDVPYLQECPCGEKLIDELKEYNIEFREF